MYQSSSFEQAGITRDYQQVPLTPDFSAQYNKATTPAPLILQDRPNYIIVNTAGSYEFLYESTGSSGGTTTIAGEAHTSGALVAGAAATPAGPVQLLIHPVSWFKHGGDGKAGDVTFIYTGVK